MRPVPGADVQSDDSRPTELPNLFVSVLPILLPVLLISTNTVVSTLGANAPKGTGLSQAVLLTGIIGNPNVALLLSAAVALVLYVVQCRPTRDEVGLNVERALMSAGIIILITSAGGAFGEMLKAARVGPVIQEMFSGQGASTGLSMIFVGWTLACLLKISQGSSTVAMITTSSIMAAMIDPATLGIHPVYLATAIGSGSLCISWMNDSGFWIVARMSGLTEMEALKTWTVALIVLSGTGLLVTLLLATVLPMAF